jgi:hypothetical protein
MPAKQGKRERDARESRRQCAGRQGSLPLREEEPEHEAEEREAAAEVLGEIEAQLNGEEQNG